MNHLDLDQLKRDKITLTNRQKEVLEIYKQRHAANLHKMKEIPCCTIPSDLKSK